MKKGKLTFILGTRPEVIKLAPVILEAKGRGHSVQVVLTGQHKHLSLPLLKFFGIEPELDLGVMSHNQSLPGLSARLLEALSANAASLKSDLFLVQGDTTSAFVAAYWAFCEGIRVAHVEAGLRTNHIRNPFPEEANRQLIGRLADFHFAPTSAAREALRKEGITASRIFKVGNTAIDALAHTMNRLRGSSRIPEHERANPALLEKIAGRKLVLVTAHRRESFGKPLQDLCAGIRRLVDSDENLCVVYPVHPNPNVRTQVEATLGKHPRILLVEPLPYVAFVTLMDKASLILTDSGGVQEEAPSLRKPILVMRETSERPEGIAKGFAKLVGTKPEKIYREGKLALRRGCTGRGGNPYGDGKASARIMKVLEERLF